MALNILNRSQFTERLTIKYKKSNLIRLLKIYQMFINFIHVAGQSHVAGIKEKQ